VLEEIKFATEIRILHVVPHNGVTEEVTIPVGYQASSFVTGNGHHLAHNASTETHGHNVESVVHADHQRTLKLFVQTFFEPPFVEHDSDILNQKSATFLNVVLLVAKGHKLGIDIQSEARNLGQTIRDAFIGTAVNQTNNISRSGSNLDDHIMVAAYGHFRNLTTSLVVSFAKDGPFLGNRFVPGSRGHEGPDLLLNFFHRLLSRHNSGMSWFNGGS